MAKARRRKHEPKPPKFEIDRAINAMEARVIRALVPGECSGMDLIEWLVPQEAITALKAAAPYTGMGGGMFDAFFSLDGMKVHTTVDPSRYGMITPYDRDESVNRFSNRRAVEFQPSARAEIMRAEIMQAIAIKRDFDVVRRVVKWMNDNEATHGWARHYIPALGSLLDPDHAFHKVTGAVFRQIAMPHEIATDIRRIPEIITRGLLCGEGQTGAFFGKLRLGGENAPVIPWFRS